MNAVISAALEADIPVLLWGPPGTGKTAALRDLARRKQAHVEVLIGSSVDPTDLAGREIPTADGRLVCAPPPWAARLREALDAKRPAWLLLDELSTATPSVQAALLRLVHERRVGDVDLRGCRIVGAANRADTAADGGWLAPASANRWSHVNWSLAAHTWVAGELGGWGRPPPVARADAAVAVTSYIARNPAALLGPPTGDAYPTPRSWSATIDMLAVAPRTAWEAIAASCVGAPASAEWTEWLARQDLPSGEDLLESRVEWPTRGDRILAAGYALVAASSIEHAERRARIEKAAVVIAKLRSDVAVAIGAALVDVTGEVPEALRPIAQQIRDTRKALAQH